MKDKDWLVNSAAASALGAQNSLPDDAIQALIKYLKEENGKVRLAAASVLGNQSLLPDDAIQALIEALKEENGEVRSAAVMALGHHMTQLLTWLPRLARPQTEVLYIQVLFPRSCEQIAPLYFQDDHLHFYTAMGPGQPIPLNEEQCQRIQAAFKTAQAEAGMEGDPPWIEE